MVTINQINKALKAAGIDKVELVKGKGYFYFVGDGLPSVSNASVNVYRLKQLSIEQWVDECKSIINNA